MKRTGRIVCGLILLLTARSLTAANVADFVDYSLVGRGVQLPGRLYVPPEAISNPAVVRPLILFLHGGGETGTNNLSQINANIDNLLAEAKSLGAYLYAPQSTTNWNSTTLTSNVMTMIDRAVAEQNVDSRRLYVTGLSNGGGGTWNMLSRFPGRFAAGLPISGISPAADFAAANLVDTPIWAFHARDDTVVSVNSSRSVVNSLLASAHEPLPSYPAAGSSTDFFLSNPNLNTHRILEQLVDQQPNVSDSHIGGDQLDLLYYELSFGGHAIWSGVYDSPPVYGWLFSHALPVAVPEPASLCLMLFGVAVLLGGRRAFAMELKPAQAASVGADSGLMHSKS
jgi:poly(3-hydroxybutyrate) depolymerase